MVGVVVAAHGQLAKELYTTTIFIVGKADQMMPLSIDPSRPVEEMQKEIEKAIKKVDSGDGVLILTDMFGGTPANMCLVFHKEGEVEIVTGVNLPMLIKLCQGREGKSLAEVAQEVVEYGRKSINQATEILKK